MDPAIVGLMVSTTLLALNYADRTIRAVATGWRGP